MLWWCKGTLVSLSFIVASSRISKSHSAPQPKLAHNLCWTSPIPNEPRLVMDNRRGFELASDPFSNVGLAYTDETRDVARLRGLLPASYISMEQQVETMKAQIDERSSPFEKYLQMESIRDANVQLFYALLVKYPDDLLPIVYTPVVGEACLKMSKIYLPRPRGLFLTLADRGRVKEVLQNWPMRDVRVIVFTDGGRILGLGDLGANGMGIPLGKIALYTALGGVPPEQCLAVTLDVGTDNKDLLNDPSYIGTRAPRSQGPEYDELVTEFMTAAMEVYGPQVLLQFEDFGNTNAFRLLDTWQDKACSFNDDIQGTAAVVLAGLMASTRLTGRALKDETYLFLGAGSAAIGIADLIAYAVHKESGTPLEEARRRIFLFDSKGLVVADRKAGGINSQKQRYAHKHEDAADFVSAIKAVRPTGIIGVSTIPKSFSKEVLETMAALNESPVVFALSNPTSKSECTFQEAMDYTRGRAIFASGSAFPPLTVDGTTLIPGQANNCYIFPGIGLGVLASGIKRVTGEDIYIAARTLASQVSTDRLKVGCLFPPLTAVRDVSAAIAAAISENAQKTGRLTAAPQADFYAFAKSIMYKPVPLEI